MSERSGRSLNQETSSIAGQYLFKLPPDESKALDMRTRINSPETMKAMMYYGVLGESLGSEKAKEIKDLMERLLISSDKGMGRAEAVETLRQNLPKRVEVDKGTDGSDFKPR
jgi:hypothetical protein